MEFANIKDFIKHLAKLEATFLPACHAAVRAGAKIIEKEAKNEIGTYQLAAGPFPEWPLLTVGTIEDRERQGYSASEPLLRTGEMRDSIGTKAEGLEAVVGSNDDIAVYQEHGTATIPPRSFLGGAAFRMAPKVVEIIGERAVWALSGRGRFTG